MRGPGEFFWRAPVPPLGRAAPVPRHVRDGQASPRRTPHQRDLVAPAPHERTLLLLHGVGVVPTRPTPFLPLPRLRLARRCAVPFRRFGRLRKTNR